MGSAFQEAGEVPGYAQIRAALGSYADLWDQAVALCEDTGATVEWRYYRDGGWLANAARGKKTVAWLSVEPSLLRVTFYFAERHRAVLTDSQEIAAEVRARVSATPMMGRLLPVSFEVRDAADLAEVEKVLAIKLSAH